MGIGLDPVRVRQTLAIEQPNNRVRVSYVNREQHPYMITYSPSRMNGRLDRLQVGPDVENRCGVREGANRDKIHASRRDGTSVGKGQAT